MSRFQAALRSRVINFEAVNQTPTLLEAKPSILPFTDERVNDTGYSIDYRYHGYPSDVYHWNPFLERRRNQIFHIQNALKH